MGRMLRGDSGSCTTRETTPPFAPSALANVRRVESVVKSEMACRAGRATECVKDTSLADGSWDHAARLGKEKNFPQKQNPTVAV